MEAIRNGASGLDELTNFVISIDVGGAIKPFNNGAEVIGLLSSTGTVNTATIRAISGAVSERGPQPRTLHFVIQLQVQISPF